MPRTFADIAECVESTLGRVGPRRLPVRELRAMS
jgi:hypothetical protein